MLKTAMSAEKRNEFQRHGREETMVSKDLLKPNTKADFNIETLSDSQTLKDIPAKRSQS